MMVKENLDKKCVRKVLPEFFAIKNLRELIRQGRLEWPQQIQNQR